MKFLRNRSCLRILFPLFALTSIAACAQTKTISWKEEVRLTNGQTIVVERSQDYRRVYSGGPFRLGWLRDHERLSASLQSPRREVKWQGEPIPLALDVAPDGNVYVVAVTTAGMAGENEYGRKLQPNETYYVAYQYDRDKSRWQRILITAVPLEFRPNMLVDTYGLFIQGGSTVTFVDFALKAKVDSDPRISRDLRDWPRK